MVNPKHRSPRGFVSPEGLPAWGAAVGTLPSAGPNEWGLADGNRHSHNLGHSASSRKAPQPSVCPLALGWPGRGWKYVYLVGHASQSHPATSDSQDEGEKLEAEIGRICSTVLLRAFLHEREQAGWI